MPLHESTPGEGGRKALHWSHSTTDGGESWQAYVAGHCHWFQCHREGRHTKPCVACVSGGDVECAHDHNINEPVERGYMPLVRKSDYKPVFVIVYPHLRDHIDALKWKHLVTVTRGKGGTDTVTLLPALGKFPPFHSTLSAYNKPCDLTESLLRIWKMGALTEWYRRTHSLSDKAVSLPAERSAKKKTPLKENDIRTLLARNMIEGAGGEQPEAIASEDWQETMKALQEKVKKKEAEKNGKH